MAFDEQDYVMLDANDIQESDGEELAPLSVKELSEVQEWLLHTNYDAPSSEYGKHHASHLSGTGVWLQYTEQYRQWHGSDRGALWIKGVAGAGKSVLAASLITQLKLDETAPILYFFFRHIISANQTPNSLVRDFLSQLLEHSPGAQHRLYKLVDNKRELDSVAFDELWGILVSALTQMPRVYCVVDALDEMIGENDSFIGELLALAQKKPATIKVLITSRPVPQVEKTLRHPSVLQLLLQSNLVDPDISRYVGHRVSQWPVEEDLRSSVYDTMCKKAQGHFLYARLMMDDLEKISLGSTTQERDLLHALNTLPAPMADMYTQMLLDHSRRSRVPQELQVTLLQWVTRAERPLRLLELGTAIGFEQKAQDIKAIVRKGCGPLLEILEDETVCPIHHSFTEYLYDSNRPTESRTGEVFPILENETTQRSLAMTCVKYLASGWHKSRSFTGKLNDDEKTRNIKMEHPFLDYASKYWSQHIRKSGSTDAGTISGLDLFLVHDPAIPHAWLELVPYRANTYEHAKSKIMKSRTALHIAAEYGLGFYIEHLLKRGGDIECHDIEKHTPLALAAREGQSEALAVLLKNGAQNDTDNNNGLKPLHLASMRNNPSVITLLLQSGVDPCTPKTREASVRRCGNGPRTVGHTPVIYACRDGHWESIKAFIPFLDDNTRQEALYWALRFDQSKVARVLLETSNIDVNHRIADQTPLHWACMSRNIELMRLLLTMGADPQAFSSGDYSYGGFERRNSTHDETLRPLYAFARGGRRHRQRNDWDQSVMISGFNMLLDAGADLHTRDSQGRSILHALLSGVRSGYYETDPEPRLEEVLSVLFDRGLSANATDVDGSNVLHTAFKISNKALDMLIAHGAQVNAARKSDRKTPLIVAAEWGYFKLVESLVAHGADVNLADHNGNTALHYLAKSFRDRKSLDGTKTLLIAGANVHARNIDGNTPLHLYREPKMKLRHLFTQFGFDLGAKNKRGETILFAEVHRRNRAVCNQFIEAGASPFTCDARGRSILHILVTFVDENSPKLIHEFVERGLDPLLRDLAGNNLFHAFVQSGCGPTTPAVFDLLKKYNVPISGRNWEGQTPLHAVCSLIRTDSGNKNIDFFLEHMKADINVADHQGICPIHLTASWEPNLTWYLLELGADPSVQTVEGQTPLMVACRTRQPNTVCMLLDHLKTQDQLHLVNQTDKKGYSALHYACKSGIPETVSLLIKAGADVGSFPRKQALTPLHVCAEYLEEQATWDATKALEKPKDTMYAHYVLLADRPQPYQDHWHSQQPRIRDTVRLLIENGANLSFLTMRPTKPNLPSSVYPRDARATGDPLTYAIRKGCEPMVSELLRIQEQLLQVEFNPQEKMNSQLNYGTQLSIEEKAEVRGKMARYFEYF